MTTRLLALDLDGTLLRPDGGIDPRDLAAIRRARAAGVVVTIATGRLVAGALPTARELNVEVPLICADGAVVVCGRTGARLESVGIDLGVAERAMHTHAAHGLAPFVLMHDEIHCDETGREHYDFVRVWTAQVTVHPRLADATAWRRPDEVAMAVAIGAQARVAAAQVALDREHAEHIESVVFALRNPRQDWALLSRPRGASKGLALERLAARLGVAREHVAAVGDWFNDVSMLTWAGRSFAMGHAPPGVRAAATDTLEATAQTGGGVAEAVERWLG